MNIHKLARTTPASRALIASRRAAGIGAAVVAEQLGIDRKTVRKWTRRRKTEGPEGLNDRSSRPRNSPNELAPEWKAAVVALRRLRFTQDRVAQVLGLSKSRIQRVVASRGLGKLSVLEPPVPENRYQRAKPGELVHVDTKKLGRFFQPGHRVTGDRTSSNRLKGHKGWEFLHIAIDDCTRLAFAELLPDEKGATCAAFLLRAARFYRRHGIPRIERVMSDNGAGYKNDFAAAVAELGAKHKRTRPYTPRTNGKAERFIQTMLRLSKLLQAAFGPNDPRAKKIARELASAINAAPGR